MTSSRVLALRVEVVCTTAFLPPPSYSVCFGLLVHVRALPQDLSSLHFLVLRLFLLTYQSCTSSARETLN